MQASFEVKIGQEVMSGFDELCRVDEISACGEYIGLIRLSDGMTIGSCASLIKPLPALLQAQAS